MNADAFTIGSDIVLGSHVQDPASAAGERLLAHAIPLGLYAEELDPVTGRHLGNFPQAFTHLALINAVLHVIELEGELGNGTRAD